MSHEPTTASPLRVHGHDVMRLLVAAGRPMTREGVVEAVVARFGPGARFHTCAANGMTAGEVVAFLEARGKFVAAGGGVTTDASRICWHEHEQGHGHWQSRGHERRHTQSLRRCALRSPLSVRRHGRLPHVPGGELRSSGSVTDQPRSACENLLGASQAP